jgi:hypothetical protein
MFWQVEMQINSGETPARTKALRRLDIFHEQIYYGVEVEVTSARELSFDQTYRCVEFFNTVLFV